MCEENVNHVLFLYMNRIRSYMKSIYLEIHFYKKNINQITVNIIYSVIDIREESIKCMKKLMYI